MMMSSDSAGLMAGQVGSVVEASVSRVSDVELYAAIRRDARAGMAKRALQRKYRVGLRTVVAALESAWPEPRKKACSSRESVG
jgi:hypothetical protein